MGRDHQRLRLTRFSIILPSVQVPLAIGLWEWSRYEPRARSLESFPWPTGGLICYGINAPAIFSRVVAYPFRMAQPPGFLVRYSPAEIAFFLGVALLWFLVGAGLDRMVRGEADRRMTVGRIVWHVLLLLMGIVLLLQAVRGFSNPWQQGNYWGSITENILFVAWSLVLMWIPVSKLVNRRRKAPPTPA
jgi:hypothetical protein